MPTIENYVVAENRGNHLAFEEAQFKAELPLVVVNPLQERYLAQAVGQRAKDRLGGRAGAGPDGSSAGPAAD